MKFLLIVSFVFSNCVSAQSVGELLEGWKLRELPVEAVLQYRDKKHRNKFVIEDHTLTDNSGNIALSYGRRSKSNLSVSVRNAKFISVNKGEFGGEFGVEVNGVYTKLMEGNVTNLIHTGDALVVVEGISHLSLTRGAVYIMDDVANPEPPKILTMLPEKPSASFIDSDGRLMVATDLGVYGITAGPRGRLDILYRKAFWARIFARGPTSIVEFEGNYLIGLAGGVAVVEKGRFEIPKVRFFATENLIRTIGLME
ncbi:hypothetical protein KFE80_03255 [bacterium SCSIO 12696]|nr:hypothetical protein KFE80_03255 [bacterium SCSIO 12696]